MEADTAPGQKDLGISLLIVCTQMRSAVRFFRSTLDTADEALSEIEGRLAGYETTLDTIPKDDTVSSGE